MLVLLPPPSLNDEGGGEMEAQALQVPDFSDFSVENLLDSLDFDDLFSGTGDGDGLPDLEMDPEIFAEFSAAAAAEESEVTVPTASPRNEHLENGTVNDEKTVTRNAASVVQTKKRSPEVKPKEADKAKKSAASLKNQTGKKKVKVDWTPELHRRFVQAVEQLGVDKAVPSRILELMGIDCLTRHNVASHLQKYRSHRKHLLAREAEAASWNQRRQMYGAAASGPAKKDHVTPWIAPTIGFPPVPQHFRALHVWGHPSADQSIVPMWPARQLSHPPPPPHAWPPEQPPHHPPAPDPSLWIPHHHVPSPCYSPHLPSPRFPAMPVPGIPPPAGFAVVPSMHHGQSLPQPPSDIHPSTESVDAAIGDVLSKPWLPLPLGLKPPSVDSVMVELQRQGISKIPPTYSS